MESALDRKLAGADVPPFSYTGIAHTFRNSPFNEYPYAMARLRWFMESFDPVTPDMLRLKADLLERAQKNGNFAYLQTSDAGFVDRVLDEIYREISGGLEREARDFGPHEPGIGRWVNEDPLNQRYWLDLPVGIGRQDLFDRVFRTLAARNTGEAVLDELYLYPPDYGEEPDAAVRHAFRIFAHPEPNDMESALRAGARLRQAVTGVLEEIAAGPV